MSAVIHEDICHKGFVMRVKNFVLNDKWVRFTSLLKISASLLSLFALSDRLDDLLNSSEGEVAARSRRIARAFVASHFAV